MTALRALALLAAPSLLASLLGSPALAKPTCTRACVRPSLQEVDFCQRTQCAGLQGKAARRCGRMCGEGSRCAPMRTLAYVVNECRTDAQGFWVARQGLRVRRGDCEPVTVMEFPFGEPVEEPLRGVLGQLVRAAGFDVPPGGLCQLYGAFRSSDALVLIGNFHRLGVSPDGSAVVFEVTDDFAVDTEEFPGLLPDLIPAPAQEGIFVVSADGRGLRRLADASRVRSFGFILDPTNPLLFRFDVKAHLGFSPNGRKVVYADLGPGPAGEEADQVVTLDIVTGRRVQVTRLPVAPRERPTVASTITNTRFIDDETIWFRSTANPAGLNPEGIPRLFTVKADGSGLRRVPALGPGGAVADRFEITGRKGSAIVFALVGEPVNTIEFAESRPIEEAFLLDGKQLIQLTNFHRSDTYSEFLTENGRRVFFRASKNVFSTRANPAGTNPPENCQLFSIDRLGAHLRQLTYFREGERSVRGCTEGPPPGCVVGPAFQDPVTQSTVFFSGCDPFGKNPYGGQMFAMRPEGSGLRQLTDFRGLVTQADGSATVELPGPFAYSRRLR